MQEKKLRILYFIEGDIPTVEELEDAKAIGTSMFRNASVHDPLVCLEECDFVAGCAPDEYLQKYKVAKVPKSTKPPAKGDDSKPKTTPPPPPPPATGAPPWSPQ